MIFGFLLFLLPILERPRIHMLQANDNLTHIHSPLPNQSLAGRKSKTSSNVSTKRPNFILSHIKPIFLCKYHMSVGWCVILPQNHVVSESPRSQELGVAFGVQRIRFLLHEVQTLRHTTKSALKNPREDPFFGKPAGKESVEIVLKSWSVMFLRKISKPFVMDCCEQPQQKSC